MTRWEAVLEEQVKLLNFWRSATGEDYANAFAEDMTRKGRNGADITRLTPRIESDKLEVCEPVFVDEEVLQLIEAAAPTFEPEPFAPDDFFATSGFAVLPRPFYLTDVAEKQCSFRAFSWGPLIMAPVPDSKTMLNEAIPLVANMHRRMHLTFYAHWEDEDDYTPEMWSSVVDLDPESRAQAIAGWRKAFGGCDLSMFHNATISFGRLPGALRDDLDDSELTEDQLEVQALNRAAWRPLWQFIQVFFRLAQQRIVKPTSARPPRATRRRAARSGMDKDEVLVVTLRRESCHDSKPGESEEGNWSRRWIVQGHWRNQWYPSLGIHKQVWIAPFVKGPEDKPLVLHANRAFEFVR